MPLEDQVQFKLAGPVYLDVGYGGRAVAETRELIPGEILGDYDSDGDLIGVEVLGLAAVTIRVLKEIGSRPNNPD